MNFLKGADLTDLNSIRDTATSAATSAAADAVESELQQAAQQLVQELNSAMQSAGMDPLSLPEVQQEFTSNFCCIPMTGTAQLNAGQVTGLATVQPEVEVQVEGKVAIANVRVTLGPMAGSVNAVVSLSCCSADPVITFSCLPITVRLQLQLDIKSKKLSLTDFSVEELPQMRVRASDISNPLLRGRLRPLLRSQAETQHQRVKEIMDNQVKQLLEQLVQDKKQGFFKKLFG